MSTNKSNKPKQVTWFNGCGGRIGIVVGTEGDYAYIGAALKHDENSDVEHILQYGARFPLAAALLLAPSKSYTSVEAEGVHAPETESF